MRSTVTEAGEETVGGLSVSPGSTVNVAGSRTLEAADDVEGADVGACRARFAAGAADLVSVADCEPTAAPVREFAALGATAELLVLVDGVPAAPPHAPSRTETPIPRTRELARQLTKPREFADKSR